MTFAKHASQIAAPIASRPSSALFEEDRVILQRSLDLDLGVVLHVGFPSVRDHPASNEIVVVGIELVLAKPPFFVGEGVGETVILQNLGPIGNGAAGQTRHTAIHVSGGGAVKVAALEVERAEEVPDAFGKGGIDSSAQALAGHHAAVTLVSVERGQDPRQGSGRPADIVVGKDSNGSADLRNGPGHLTALVGVGDGEEANSGVEGRHSTQHLLGLFAIGLDGDKQQLGRPVVQDGADCFNQLVTTSLQSGYDHGHIIGIQPGALRDGNCFEGVERPQVDDQAGISVDAGRRLGTD
jgi:hypothetical protein